jgi:ABC-type bacteriocin/lantibiotic exporter with double-glycine peptidase domain
MKTAFNVFSGLDRRDQVVYFLILASRVGLVFLDLIGIIMVGIAVSLVTGVSTTPTSATGRLLEAFTQMGITNSYLAVSLVAVLFFFAKGFGSMALNRINSRGISAIEQKQTSKIFDAMLKSNVSKLEGWSVPQVNQALGFSSEMAFGKSLTSLSIAFGEVVLIFVIVGFLAVVSLPLFIALIIYGAAVAIVMSLAVGRRNRKLASEMSKGMLRTGSLIEDALRNFRQLRAARVESWFLSEFRTQRSLVARASNDMSALAVLPRYITEIALIVAVGGLVVARSFLGDEGLPVAVATIFVASVFRLVASLLPLQGSLLLLQQVDEAAALALQARDFFELKDDTDLETAQKSDPKGNAKRRLNYIEIIDLSFSYPGKAKPVLDRINFELRKGDFVALTGVSGAGKSTLADLILGLRVPSTGRLTIEGLSPSEYLRQVASGIGYVSQNAQLLSGTLVENITMELGSQNFDAEKLSEAIELAQLTSVIEGLPQGIHTQLGSGRLNLSGGQVQRVALARAIYRRPALLVLDEATSALDHETEKAVSDALRQLSGKVTIIAIAHRRSTIRAASSVWNLQNGKLAKTSPELF